MLSIQNSMDCIVHEVAKRWTQVSDFHFHFLEFLTTGKVLIKFKENFNYTWKNNKNYKINTSVYHIVGKPCF